MRQVGFFRHPAIVSVLSLLLVSVAFGYVSRGRTAIVHAASIFVAGQPGKIPIGPVREGRLIGHVSGVSRRQPSVPSVPFRPLNVEKWRAQKAVLNQDRGNKAPITPRRLPTTTRSLTSASFAETKLLSFSGISNSEEIASFGSDQEVTPPDTQVAAGPAAVVEMVNSSAYTWSREGSLISSTDLNRFFGVPSGYLFTDPRVLYDATSGRWVASGASIDAFGDSQVYVAVSETSDPSVPWWIYVVSNESQTIDDQPKIGASSDKVIISWNDYNIYGTFVGSETYVMQKSDLLSGSPVHWWHFGPDTQRFSIVPSQELSSSTTAYLVYNNSDYLFGSENQGYPTVGVVAITGTPAQYNVQWFEADPSISQTFLPPDAVQPQGPLVSTNDDRFLSAVWENGILWASGNDLCPTSFAPCARTIQLLTNASYPLVLQNFDTGLIGGAVFYPAVTMDGAGDAFFAFSISSPSLYPSTATTTQPTTFGVDTTTALILDRAGLGETNSCGTSCTYTNNRWGDYSAAATDPINPANVWIAAEYVPTSTTPQDWGTGVSVVSLQAVAPPTNTPIPTATTPPSPTETPLPPTPTVVPTATAARFHLFVPDVEKAPS